MRMMALVCIMKFPMYKKTESFDGNPNKMGYISMIIEIGNDRELIRCSCVGKIELCKILEGEEL